MPLELNILEQLISTEFDVGHDQNLILIKNTGNPRTGMIEFDKGKNMPDISVEELTRSFYSHSRFNLTENEYPIKNSEITILRFYAAKESHRYLITILKTNYHNSIFINQEE